MEENITYPSLREQDVAKEQIRKRLIDPPKSALEWLFKGKCLRKRHERESDPDKQEGESYYDWHVRRCNTVFVDIVRFRDEIASMAKTNQLFFAFDLSAIQTLSKRALVFCSIKKGRSPNHVLWKMRAGFFLSSSDFDCLTTPEPMLCVYDKTKVTDVSTTFMVNDVLRFVEQLAKVERQLLTPEIYQRVRAAVTEKKEVNTCGDECSRAEFDMVVGTRYRTWDDVANLRVAAREMLSTLVSHHVFFNVEDEKPLASNKIEVNEFEPRPTPHQIQKQKMPLEDIDDGYDSDPFDWEECHCPRVSWVVQPLLTHWSVSKIFGEMTHKPMSSIVLDINVNKDGKKDVSETIEILESALDVVSVDYLYVAPVLNELTHEAAYPSGSNLGLFAGAYIEKGTELFRCAPFLLVRGFDFEFEAKTKDELMAALGQSDKSKVNRTREQYVNNPIVSRLRKRAKDKGLKDNKSDSFREFVDKVFSAASEEIFQWISLNSPDEKDDAVWERPRNHVLASLDLMSPRDCPNQRKKIDMILRTNSKPLSSANLYTYFHSMGKRRNEMHYPRVSFGLYSSLSFVNHACPESATASLSNHEDNRTVIVRAARDIQKGQEITYSYHHFGGEMSVDPFRCRCSSCLVKAKKL